MWICLSDAFFSVVESREDPTVLLVRARRKAHLARHFPGKKIITTAETDYPCRVLSDRETVAGLLAKQVLGISYDNFKNSVADDDLHTAYSQVWTTMRRLERPAERPKTRLRTLPLTEVGMSHAADARSYFQAGRHFGKTMVAGQMAAYRAAQGERVLDLRKPEAREPLPSETDEARRKRNRLKKARRKRNRLKKARQRAEREARLAVPREAFPPQMRNRPPSVICENCDSVVNPETVSRLCTAHDCPWKERR